MKTGFPPSLSRSLRSILILLLLAPPAMAQTPSLIWTGRFPTLSPAQALIDQGADLVLFQGDLFVTGERTAATGSTVFATCHYLLDPSGSNQEPHQVVYWPTLPNPGAGIRTPVAIAASIVAIDSDGPTPEPRPTIFVTGVVPGTNGDNTDYMTIAYSSTSFSDVFWMERMNWAGGDDTPVAISVYGNVVAVTGNSAEPGEDTEIHTVLYDAVDGSTLWTNRLGPVGLNGAAGVYVRGGSVYVVGTTHDGNDFVATSVVYSVATGNPLSGWPRSFTPSGHESAATCMYVTEDGNSPGALIVGGHCWSPSDTIDTHALVINYEGDPDRPTPSGTASSTAAARTG